MGAACSRSVDVTHLDASPELHDNLVRQQERSFDDIYQREKLLGTGAKSSVTLIRKKPSVVGGSSLPSYVKKNRRQRKRQNSSDSELSFESPAMYFALKEYDLQHKPVEQIINEIELLKAIDHPNIIKIHEIFRLDKRLALVLELASGGEIQARMPYTETQVVDIVRQTLSATKYMHERGIVHRDLKPENILYENDDERARIKIIDFGISLKSSEFQTIQTDCKGTLTSMAPEAIKKGYRFSSKVDLWSVGVLAYTLISGEEPFVADCPRELMGKISRASYHFHGEVWDQTSNLCKDFISSLLQISPSDRPTAEQALQHEWLSMAKKKNTDEIVMNAIAKSLVRYAEMGELKKLALNVIAKKSRVDEIHELRDAFFVYDKGDDGYIRIEEFRNALRTCKYSDEDISVLFNKLDINKNGVISFNEFIAATLDVRGKIEEHRIAEAFDFIDRDDSGYITRYNLRQLLGKHYRKDYVTKLIGELDKRGCGRVSYEDFRRAF